MRVPLVIVAIPLLLVGVFSIFVSPDAALRYLEQLEWVSPLRVQLASVVPFVAGNRSLGAVAISCLLYLVLKQASDYFDRPYKG